MKVYSMVISQFIEGTYTLLKNFIRAKKSLFFILLVILSAGKTSSQDDVLKKHFFVPDKIFYNSNSLIINGKEEFIYSGAFHYFRCASGLWADRFQKMKDAGFNTVETYIPWNRHETEMPSGINDFSKINLDEFGKWLQMAESYGLYVIVRPGPFICAEYIRGGYPGWLTTKRPQQSKQWMWLRSDDPVYLEWSNHWIKAFSSFIATHQIIYRNPGSGGIILMQVENEFGHVSFPLEAKVSVLENIVQTALSNGIKVPMVACDSPEISNSNSTILKKNIFETSNLYPCNQIAPGIKAYLNAMREKQPDSPLMTTELQGGWFPFVWQPQTFKTDMDFYPEGIDPAQIQNLTLYCIQNGETMLNYYMLVGGTNLDGVESKDMQTSYDYGAPIRENGATGEKYERVKAIGMMLKEHGTRLIHSKLISIDSETGSVDVEVALRQCNDGSRYFFIRNNNTEKPYSGVVKITDHQNSKPIQFNYNLAPFDSKVLYLPPTIEDELKGEWFPKLPIHQKRQDQLPSGIKLTEISFINDPVPSDWKPVKKASSLLDLGIYDNRYVYYKATFNMSQKNLEDDFDKFIRVTFPDLSAGSLTSGGNGLRDNITVLINGNKLNARMNGINGDFELPKGALKAGINEFLILYENSGYAKEFIYMEKEAGIINARILSSQINENWLQNWKFKQIDQRTEPDSLAMQVDKDDCSIWETINLSKSEPSFVKFNQRGIFCTTINMNPDDILQGKTALFISQLGDLAWVYVNGHKVGESNSRIVSRTFDLKNHLNTGLNKIIIITDNYDLYEEGGVGTVKLTYPEEWGKPIQKLEYSDVKSSVDQLKGWLPCGSFNKKEANGKSLLGWYKSVFELPKEKEGNSIHWFLRIIAQGNGSVYLNGHLIGRVWEKGMQKDFYLPECWLETGAGKKNNIVVQLKPNQEGGLIQSLEVLPYHE